jgi:hypothetical protein
MKPNAEGSQVSLYYTDSAVLESGERRRDLPCEVKFMKPQLGFDLKFHSGYVVTFPFSELQSDDLALITRVLPRGGEPSFLVQRVRTSGPRPADGIGAVQGVFSVGEGSYTANVVARDATGRVCSDLWEFSTDRIAQGAELAIEPGQISSSERNPFVSASEPAPSNEVPALRILLNFASPARGAVNALVGLGGSPARPLTVEGGLANDAAGSREADVFALMSIVRHLARHASKGGISLTVFNLEQRKILYQQDGKIDFSALGEGLQTFRPGTIEFDALAAKEEGTAKFLAGLLESGAGDQPHPPVVIISATDGVPDSFSTDSFPSGRQVNISYLHYNPDPAATQQYGDAIGKAVKSLRGKKYEVGQPRDLLEICPDLLLRLKH